MKIKNANYDKYGYKLVRIKKIKDTTDPVIKSKMGLPVTNYHIYEAKEPLIAVEYVDKDGKTHELRTHNKPTLLNMVKLKKAIQNKSFIEVLVENVLCYSDIYHLNYQTTGNLNLTQEQLDDLVSLISNKDPEAAKKVERIILDIKDFCEYYDKTTCTAD